MALRTMNSTLMVILHSGKDKLIEDFSESTRHTHPNPIRDPISYLVDSISDYSTPSTSPNNFHAHSVEPLLVAFGIALNTY